jgi:DNA-directed RNA polymerase subunit RPC12/RpoP
MSDKVVFTTHIDRRGRLNEAKEEVECPHCGGEAYEANSSSSPGGIHVFKYSCTDCKKEWSESV